ncbi:hypothetical protein RUM43_012585 [Polyplax serrata]|uniref:Uncharacterized protein n=1 Tax=Polyplax serrata TaxID=468196 RepID=A0AAN8P287_POLSC
MVVENSHDQGQPEFVVNVVGRSVEPCKEPDQVNSKHNNLPAFSKNTQGSDTIEKNIALQATSGGKTPIRISQGLRIKLNGSGSVELSHFQPPPNAIKKNHSPQPPTDSFISPHYYLSSFLVRHVSFEIDGPRFRGVIEIFKRKGRMYINLLRVTGIEYAEDGAIVCEDMTGTPWGYSKAAEISKQINFLIYKRINEICGCPT